ncbi:MAG: hypothetical protein ABMB14_18625 [Myxococcota bacterium]
MGLNDVGIPDPGLDPRETEAVVVALGIAGLARGKLPAGGLSDLEHDTLLGALHATAWFRDVSRGAVETAFRRGLARAGEVVARTGGDHARLVAEIRALGIDAAIAEPVVCLAVVIGAVDAARGPTGDEGLSVLLEALQIAPERADVLLHEAFVGGAQP